MKGEPIKGNEINITKYGMFLNLYTALICDSTVVKKESSKLLGS